MVRTRDESLLPAIAHNLGFPPLAPMLRLLVDNVQLLPRLAFELLVILEGRPRPTKNDFFDVVSLGCFVIPSVKVWVCFVQVGLHF